MECRAPCSRHGFNHLFYLFIFNKNTEIKSVKFKKWNAKNRICKTLFFSDIHVKSNEIPIGLHGLGETANITDQQT